MVRSSSAITVIAIASFARRSLMSSTTKSSHLGGVICLR
jgi:hypothetical protein